MKTGFLAFGLCLAMIILPAIAVASLSIETPNKAMQSEADQEIAHLRHKHHHCHVTVTLGHVKRRCHTHRHNKVVHHGPLYH